MPPIRHIEDEEDIGRMREPLREVLQWAVTKGAEGYPLEIAPDIEAMLELTMTELEEFSPPLGCILLAAEGSECQMAASNS